MATTETVPARSEARPRAQRPDSLWAHVWRSVRLVLLTAALMLGIAVVLEWLLAPALAAVKVDEEFTSAVAGLLIGLVPVAAYAAAGAGQRPLRKRSFGLALTLALIIALLVYGVFVVYQAATGAGAFREAASPGFSYAQGADGIEILSVDPGGAAEAAGFLPGDVILALRRDAITAADLDKRLNEAQLDDALRFRLMRNGEELQLTTRVTLASSTDVSAILRGLITPLAVALIALVIPSRWLPHLILGLALLPLLAGYFWLIVASFSTRTEGLFPIDANGNLGGWTLANWDFLSGHRVGGPTVDIWSVTLNSMVIALAITAVTLVIASMAGYALARMTFPGRKAFLQMTLILHGFPAITLIIPIFLVLINIGSLPLIGQVVGYNRPGGVALVMIAFELPLGIWLMKGFFDGISWDMERSALIDGASRWRTFWEIILPQIRPGLLALGIFSFISGWNAYLIPATYTVGTGMATLPVYIRQLTGELAPINWNQVAAVGLFQLIPILAFFIFAQEYLLNIYAGGTKGST